MPSCVKKSSRVENTAVDERIQGLLVCIPIDSMGQQDLLPQTDPLLAVRQSYGVTSGLEDLFTRALFGSLGHYYN